MTAILPNESYRPGISQITEAVFSTMLDTHHRPSRFGTGRVNATN